MQRQITVAFLVDLVLCSDESHLTFNGRIIMQRRRFLKLGVAGAGVLGLEGLVPIPAPAEPNPAVQPGTKTAHPIYCCVTTEFIQPWEQNEALRQIKKLGLGNMVVLTNTFHVGNSEEDRRFWKRQFPSLAKEIDAVPRFPDRPEHGHCAIFDLPVEFRREQVRLCRELGLLLSYWPRELPQEDRVRWRDTALFSELIACENLSVLPATRSLKQLQAMDANAVTSQTEKYFVEAKKRAGRSIFDTPERLDFQTMHDWFVGRLRTHGAGLKAQYGGPLGAGEASVQIRLAVEAGGDIPMFELVPSEPMRGLAATRGAAVAYGKDVWGVHAAMGYYRAPTDSWTPERLRIAYDLFYAGGASYFSEPNLALRNWGSCSAFFTVPDSPAIRWAEQECRTFDDPICVRSREVLSSFYRFTQFHQRPVGGPRVRLGYLLGNLDTWSGGNEERMWMVDHPGFLAPDALKSWRHFDRAYDSESWYVAPRKYYWQADPAKPLRHGTPPCGQVDLVPSESPLEKLRNYGTLVFLGWNTMTEELYGKLVTFVEGGGTLFLSVPHLDTRTRTDRPQAFFRGGDVRRLCGVRILGLGEKTREVFFAQPGANPRHVLPQGTHYLEGAQLAKIELSGAHVLAHPLGKPELPVLLQHQLGKGTVYLLSTWEYPGERLDAFITDILRTLAEAEQAEIAVEGRDIFYAVYDAKFPSGQRYSSVYLVNHDIYGQPAYPMLRVHKTRIPMRAGSELRIAWVIDNLIIAPHDRFAQVTDVHREDNAWTVTLESARDASRADRRIQIQSLGKIRAVTIDGKVLTLAKGIEGDDFVQCRLIGRHVLRLEIAK